MLFSPSAAFDPLVPACAQQTAGGNFRCRRRSWQPPPTHTALLFRSHGPGRSLLDTRAMKHTSIAPGTRITSAGITNEINPAVFVRAQSGGRRRHNSTVPASHIASLVQHHHTPALESAGHARELAHPRHAPPRDRRAPHAAPSALVCRLQSRAVCATRICPGALASAESREGRSPQPGTAEMAASEDGPSLCCRPRPSLPRRDRTPHAITPCALSGAAC